MGAAVWPRAPVGEGSEALVRVAHEPAVDGAPIDPVAGGDIGDPGAVQHLPYRQLALLNHRQLREHPGILLGSGERK